MVFSSISNLTELTSLRWAGELSDVDDNLLYTHDCFS